MNSTNLYKLLNKDLVHTVGNFLSIIDLLEHLFKEEDLSYFTLDYSYLDKDISDKKVVSKVHFFDSKNNYIRVSLEKMSQYLNWQGYPELLEEDDPCLDDILEEFYSEFDILCNVCSTRLPIYIEDILKCKSDILEIHNFLKEKTVL